MGQTNNSESAPSEQTSILIDETHASLDADDTTLTVAYRCVFISCMFCYLVTNVTLTVIFAVLANKLPARERDKDVRMYGQGKDWYPTIFVLSEIFLSIPA